MALVAEGSNMFITSIDPRDLSERICVSRSLLLPWFLPQKCPKGINVQDMILQKMYIMHILDIVTKTQSTTCFDGYDISVFELCILLTCILFLCRYCRRKC